MSKALGDGTATAYPTALDTNGSPEVDGTTEVRAAVPNDLASAIVAIETELGVVPSGAQATVDARISQAHNTYGAHDFTVTDYATAASPDNTIYEVINMTAAATVTLPSAVTNPGRMYVIINSITANGRVTVTGTGGIGGQADRYMDRTGDTLWLISNGTEWSIISYVGLVW